MKNSPLLSRLLSVTFIGSLLITITSLLHSQESVHLLHPNGPVHHRPQDGISCDSSMLYRDGQYYSGDTIHIVWEASPEVKSVSLSFSSDEGVSWTTLARDVPVGDQPYVWVGPHWDNDTSGGWHYRIRVESDQADDTSDKNVAINERPFIRLLYPNGGEILTVGDSLYVQWEFAHIYQFWMNGLLNVEYSSDNGLTWDLAGVGKAQEGGKGIRLPDKVSGKLLLRVYPVNYRRMVMEGNCLTYGEAFGYAGDTTDGAITISTSSSTPNIVPPVSSNLQLLGIAPNPVSEEGVIRWVQGAGGDASVRLFNVNGATEQVIDLGYQEGGEHNARLEGGDLPAGIYFYEVRTGMTAARGVAFIVH